MFRCTRKQASKRARSQEAIYRIHQTILLVPYGKNQLLSTRASSSTKLRVVLGARAKTSNNIPLNDIMSRDPMIQEDPFSILLGLRKHKFAFSAHIEKMYRQINVSREDNQTCWKCRILPRSHIQVRYEDNVVFRWLYTGTESSYILLPLTFAHLACSPIQRPSRYPQTIQGK